MNKAIEYKVGERLYDVTCRDDGELVLQSVTITDVVVTHTPTGKPRKPVYHAKAENFTVNGSCDIIVNVEYYYRSAVKAVSDSMRRYFSRKTSRAATSPEARLLMAIFQEAPECQIRPDDIVDVIYDLKNYHALYTKAFELDNAKVQEIEVGHA